MSKKIHVWGYLHQEGGAGPEAGHVVELLRFRGYEVTCVVPEAPPVGEKRRKYFDSIGVGIEIYRPGILTGKALWCWCQDEVFGYLASGGDKPSMFAYWPCMNWLTEAELVGLAQMPETAVLCQTEFQGEKISEILSKYSIGAKTRVCGTYFNIVSPWNRFRAHPKDRSRFDVIRIGRDDPMKYPENMWEIAYRYASPVPKGFHLVGWGPEGEARVGDPRKDGHPFFGKVSGRIIGHTHDPLLVSDMLSASHATFMYYPWQENCPRVALEAMASGSVVVGSKSGGMPEVILDGETGLLCENDEQVVHRLGLLAFDYDARETLAQAALAHLSSGLGSGDAAMVRFSDFL